jgi:regulatory protein
MDAGQRQRAGQKAYRLLALRARSEAELRARLQEGGFAESAVEAALARCRELGYLDDAQFARQRARTLAVNRLWGDRKIAADLHEKGISEELCRAAIASAREELSAEEAVERLLAARMKGVAGFPADERLKARMVRSLLGKGFSQGLIFSKLKRIQEDDFHGDDGQ